MKKILIYLLLSLLLINPVRTFADIAEGDMIVTLGENLTNEQKNTLLTEMGAPNDVQIVTVSNQEEHQYLGKYVSKSFIGTKAISSSAITIQPKGSGITVETKNINWVTDEMYVNALITAGVKDAKIYITSPVTVSGTAALTGIIKAYEISADKTIPEEVKQAANQEMVETAKLGESIGDKNAAALIAKVKEEIAKNKPKNDEELQNIIKQAANELNVKLTDEEMKRLMDFFNKLKDLNIDWNQVSDQLNKAKDRISKFLQSEEGQGFLEKIKQFFNWFFDAIKSIFS
ncbi:DUF1002 domain-containing protein [Bacillus sp. ISL-40]|uniref:DUF1002 domain-containing protein n=1 Tax=unclassified Bacillus (in: firmicutes) TaxID=185979 RepID=UPI001BE5896E|nr:MULTISPECIES: DUF1002 domain-containing protein [unclassified Bacillus (in: firmicutes)]MBT2698879.1 DUF1002 domain-containing protein [Bacillus sp. ISL-40]MBT2721672.1 DUF1002 domain-containing protein [Bacillus sp. ISL-46]MBT2744531.1 DUF1002 domain-containing protein [Bacillus sp. ISL-77]